MSSLGPTAGPPGSATSHHRLAGIRFRRALTLLLMTLVAPGSAQLVAGRRSVGRLALRIWLVVLGALTAAVLLGLVWQSFVFWLVSNTVALAVIRFTLMALAVGWALLFIDAWRLGQPLGLRQRQRLAMVGLNGVLCLSVAGSLLFASHVVAVQRDFVTAMFGAGDGAEAADGRYNVLLLGGDSGAGRWGLRPDSLTVASIDEDTGHTVLFGLPRNMANFPFPEDSTMAERFPEGFDCEGCYLNGLSTWAADHSAAFVGHQEPGVAATIEGVEGITGLDISYYAMVNLAGFRRLVDAVGGVELNVRDRIPIGGGGGEITDHIEAGVQRLDGYQTLWFARSREGADDYSRMARQKCVLGAMLEQLSPRVVVTKFRQIAEASKAVISTDLPRSEVDRFMELAVKAKSQPMTTVSFVPPLVDTADPDVELIQERVQQAIERSESRAEESSRPGARRKNREAPAEAATTGGSIGSLSQGYAANDAADLGAAC